MRRKARKKADGGWLDQLLKEFVLEISKDGDEYNVLASRGDEPKQYHGGGETLEKACRDAVQNLKESEWE